MTSAMRAPHSLLPLRLEDVVFMVAGRRIIDRVSLTLEAGSRTVIVGPNGAGKSVLLRLCHGLLRPTYGTIAWNAPEQPGEPRRQAMVFQRPVLLRRSAFANIAYALAVARVHRKQRWARAAEACAKWPRSARPHRHACSPAASNSAWRSRALGAQSGGAVLESRQPTSIPGRRTRSSAYRRQHAPAPRSSWARITSGRRAELGDESCSCTRDACECASPIGSSSSRLRCEAPTSSRDELPWESRAAVSRCSLCVVWRARPGPIITGASTTSPNNRACSATSCRFITANRRKGSCRRVGTGQSLDVAAQRRRESCSCMARRRGKIIAEGHGVKRFPVMYKRLHTIGQRAIQPRSAAGRV